ncbi:MAG: DNA repair protein RadC [Planctomycetota bacterium]|nr:DNA repair protein RadC [Planctomycetota bacterium]
MQPGPDSPRDRLLTEGSEALSTHDLLRVLVAESAHAPPGTAWKLLDGYGSLRAMAKASARELQIRHGLGPVTALRLAAALALGRRVRTERLPRGRLLRESAEIFAAFHDRLRDLPKERFVMVMLDAKNRVIREERVSEGILTASLVHPREVFAPAIRDGAAGIVVVHNHPSGDPEPSPEDHEVTARLCAVGELVGIRVLDHVVIGDGCYVSFLERGLIPD